MNCKQAKQVRIDQYLAHKGYSPAIQNSRRFMYHSMFSEDKTPSFEVSADGSMFHDWSTDNAGNIIDLAMLFCGQNNVKAALNEIATIMSIPVAVRACQNTRNMAVNSGDGGVTALAAYQDVVVMPLTHKKLLAYLRSRGICKEVAQKYCQEIHYRLASRPICVDYYAVAWKNDDGGYEMRNKIVKQAISPKCVTTVTDLAGCPFLVLEGFMDFLSAVILGWFDDSRMNAIVLNSTSQLPKALSLLSSASRIICLLDNDDSGRHATKEILARFDNAEDWSSLYAEFKDLNEMLIAIR